MSIQSEITRITNSRDSAFDEVQNKGVTVPSGATIDDLPGLIRQILTGGGGGGFPGITDAAAGIITVETDIATPANTATKLFPGLDLDFKPDFLWISMTRETWDGLAATASNNHIYWLVAVTSELMPVLRFGNTTSSEDRVTTFIYGGSASSTTADTDGGHGVWPGFNVSNALWALNDDGTLSYSRNGTGSNAKTAIYAGQYQYIAVKLNGGN